MKRREKGAWLQNLSSWRRLGRLSRKQRGSFLLEPLIAVAVFAIVGTAVLHGLQTSYSSKGVFETQSRAENLIRNQMEYALSQAYVPPPGTYALITAPPTYAITAAAIVYDETSANIETVQVTIFKDGQQVKQLETLRSNR